MEKRIFSGEMQIKQGRRKTKNMYIAEETRILRDLEKAER